MLHYHLNHLSQSTWLCHHLNTLIQVTITLLELADHPLTGSPLSFSSHSNSFFTCKPAGDFWTAALVCHFLYQWEPEKTCSRLQEEVTGYIFLLILAQLCSLVDVFKMTFLNLALCYWPLWKQYSILNSPKEFESRIQEDRTSFPLSNLWVPFILFEKGWIWQIIWEVACGAKNSVDLKIDNSGLPPLLFPDILTRVFLKVLSPFYEEEVT